MRKLVPLVALLALSAGTAFGGKLVINALEMHSADFTLPETTTGTVNFKRCGKCPVETARATASTVYELYKRPVTLSELRTALKRKPAALAVLYRMEDKTLVRISAY